MKNLFFKEINVTFVMKCVDLFGKRYDLVRDISIYLMDRHVSFLVKCDDFVPLKSIRFFKRKKYVVLRVMY